MNNQKKLLLAAAFIAAGLGALIGSYFYSFDYGAHKPASEFGGEFTLESIDGDVSLSDFSGKVVVIYFGFLSCTEACPQSMAKINSMLRRLSEQDKQQLQILFVSVDPKRDSLQALNQFSNYYAEQGNVLAITGTEAEIKALTQQYNVLFDLIDLEGSALGYTVDHTSQFYFVDQAGKLLKTMSHSTTTNELRAQVELMLHGDQYE